MNGMDLNAEADPFDALISGGVTAQGMDPSAEPTVVGLPGDEAVLGSAPLEVAVAAELDDPGDGWLTAPRPVALAASPDDDCAPSTVEVLGVGLLPAVVADAPEVEKGPATAPLLVVVDAIATDAEPGPATVQLPAVVASTTPNEAQRQPLAELAAAPASTLSVGAPRRPGAERNEFQHHHGLLLLVGVGVLALVLGVAVVATSAPTPATPPAAVDPAPTPAPPSSPAAEPPAPPTVAAPPRTARPRGGTARTASKPEVKLKRAPTSSGSLSTSDLAGWPGDKQPVPVRAPHDPEPLKRPSF